MTPEELLQRGSGLLDRGERAAAVEVFQQVLALDPRKADTLFKLGLALDELGDVDRAEQCYTKVLDIDSAYVDAWINRGLVHAGRGRLDEASQPTSGRLSSTRLGQSPGGTGARSVTGRVSWKLP